METYEIGDVVIVSDDFHTMKKYNPIEDIDYDKSKLLKIKHIYKYSKNGVEKTSYHIDLLD